MDSVAEILFIYFLEFNFFFNSNTMHLTMNNYLRNVSFCFRKKETTNYVRINL